MGTLNGDAFDYAPARKLARQILDGSIDLVAGCRALKGSLPDIGPDAPDFVLIVAGFESSTDELPIGPLRDKFHAGELARLDREIGAYVERSRATVLEACRQIIEAADRQTAGQDTASVDPISVLEGSQLSSVEFVMDYAQLRFDGTTLTAITMPSVHVSGRVFRSGDSGYRDVLCHRIAKMVRRGRIVEGEQIRIEFEDNSAVCISLRPEDYRAAEAVNLQSPYGWYVW